MGIYRLLLERYGPQDWWPAESPFEVVVGAVLTQRTSWRNVELALGRLKGAGLMSLDAVAASDLRTLGELVRPSGFFRTKARRLRGLARHIKKTHGTIGAFFKADMPAMRTELLALDGIGKETADSIILYAAGKPAFVVDAYTLRLCERLPLPAGGKGYDRVRSFFEASLPHDTELFKEFHALVVVHCKEMCRTKPTCAGCPLAPLCEYRKRCPEAKH